MHYTLLIGLAVFGATMFSSIQITRRAMLSLTPDEKIRLVDASTAKRGYGIFIVVILALAWYFSIQRFSDRQILIDVLFFAVLLILGIIAIILAQKRLARMNISKKFQHAVILASVLRIGGLLGVALGVLWPILWR